MSVDNCTATRVEARRVLEQLSCVIAVENADGAAVLRCRYEDRESTLDTSQTSRLDSLMLQATSLSS